MQTPRLLLDPTEDYNEPCGVGITFKFDAHSSYFAIFILAPDGPAARSEALQRGDLLVGVNGLEVRGKPLPVIARLIAGKHGTSVSMEFMRRRPDFRGETIISFGNGAYKALNSKAYTSVPVSLVRARVTNMVDKEAVTKIQREMDAVGVKMGEAEAG
mmetsp:Transcript_32189/g.50222  ORF Transcript_32189/g.50222 Transcript_32189/m.50222 type:complete len:158 (-) Transcript_32189:407-880(-)